MINDNLPLNTVIWHAHPTLKLVTKMQLNKYTDSKAFVEVYEPDYWATPTLCNRETLFTDELSAHRSLKSK